MLSEELSLKSCPLGHEYDADLHDAIAHLRIPELSLKSCPLGHEYDADLHDAIAYLRILDGSLPEHAKLGHAVKFSAPAGTAKYWVKSSSPVFGYFFYYTWLSALTLPQSLECQSGIPPRKAEVDELLNA